MAGQPELKSVSLSGHESFPFRNTWLTKGVRFCSTDPSSFSRPDAMVELGVGKNMVRSIRHWCLATRVIEDDPDTKNNRGRYLRPSPLGRKIFLEDNGWDPYLEDAATLWLIHWSLATNTARATTWFFAFNLLHQTEFTRQSLEHALMTYCKRVTGSTPNLSTLKRDIDVFIRTYVAGSAGPTRITEESIDCPLTELGLIFEQVQHNQYSFARGNKDSLPDAVFAFALAEYISWHPNLRSLTFDELAYGPLGPGRVFRLDEPSLAERLDRMASLTDDAWQFSETEGYTQLFLFRTVDRFEVMDNYYRSKVERATGALK